MKFIHCADIHLDSPLAGVSNSALRRRELFAAFENVMTYAENIAADGIIIAGDLFDVSPAPSTVKNVAELFNRAQCQIYVLQGNHGGKSAYDSLKQLTGKNVRYFGDDWTVYNCGNVTICGKESVGAECWQSLPQISGEFNILALHGDVDSDAYGVIDKKAIAQSRFDYVALGHRHSFATYKFGKVPAAYCGVLEPRGFDERGQTGFIVIDTDKKDFTFVSQNKRKVAEVTLDADGAESTSQLALIADKAVSEAEQSDYLDLRVKGAVCKEVNVSALKDRLVGKFFALRLTDETTVKTDGEALSKEASLRGEFYRLAQSISDERTRNEVLRTGLAALSGEVLE
ncbi:MAG: DNA repair exonuclease [Corallococcus sp.]|nr:DNA repair exonuclease [Corallococcus sp.]